MALPQRSSPNSRGDAGTGIHKDKSQKNTAGESSRCRVKSTRDGLGSTTEPRSVLFGHMHVLIGVNQNKDGKNIRQLQLLGVKRKQD